MSIQRILKNEYSVLNNTKRIGKISKSCLNNVNTTQKYMIQAKYLKKKVGIEPVIGLVLGTFANPIPGGAIIGYMLGRAINILRKNTIQIIK